MAVGGVPRVAHEDSLAGVQEGGDGQHQGAGGPRGDDDAPPVHRHTLPFLVETGDGLAQLEDALGGRVAGRLTRGEDRLCPRQDRLRGAEIRLPHLQMDDVAALGLQGPRPRQEAHGEERPHAPRAAGQPLFYRPAHRASRAARSSTPRGVPSGRRRAGRPGSPS